MIVYSIPISTIGGIGYIFKSGVCGINYQDLTYVFLNAKLDCISKTEAREQ